MKASVNKITEGAKVRDTLGRNRVSNLTNSVSFGMRLEVIQTQMSSDNVEKLTNIIVIDKDTGLQWLLKYRILAIDGAVVDTDDTIEKWVKTLSPDYIYRISKLITPDMNVDIVQKLPAEKEEIKDDSE